MKITNLFIDHPCKMICIPYLALFVFGFIAFSNGMFDIATANNDDSLLLSDPILMDDNMIKLSADYLGTEAIAKENEEKMKDKYRHSSSGFLSIGFVLYQNTDVNNKYGLLKKQYLSQILHLEY